jgi:hypothetical protein
MVFIFDYRLEDATAVVTIGTETFEIKGTAFQETSFLGSD